MVFQYLILGYYAIALIAIIIEIKNNNPEFKRLKWSLTFIVAGYLLNIFDIQLSFQVVMATESLFFKIGLALFVAIECFYRLANYIKDASKTQVQLKSANLKSTLLLESFEKSQHNFEQIKLIKHDINAHLKTLVQTLDEKNYDRAKSYIGELIENQPLMQTVNVCQHPLINAIINKSIDDASRFGIKFDYKVSVKKDITISDNDICSLLTNILDNAIEACVNHEDSWISFSCHIKNGYFCVSCINKAEGKIEKSNGEFISNKPDKQRHGLGIKIIKQIVNDYSGMINIGNDVETFRLEIALKLES